MTAARRGFLRHLALGSLSATLIPMTAQAAWAERAVAASTGTDAAQGTDLTWTRRLTGRYKAVHDSPDIGGGLGVLRAGIVSAPLMAAFNVSASAISPVIVLRHAGYHRPHRDVRCTLTRRGRDESPRHDAPRKHHANVTYRRATYRRATCRRETCVSLTMDFSLRNRQRLVGPLALAVLSMPLPAQPTHTAGPDLRAAIPAIEAYIAQQMQRNRIPGVAVAIVSNDSVIYARGFGTDGFGAPLTERTGFVLGSMSKSVTALAIMQLVERNLVQLDAPVQQYLPWFRVADPSASARITVRQLLHHTSGIPTRAPRATGAAGTLDGQVRALADVALNNAPGAVHEYASPNYLVLGAIVEAVSQRSYASYVQESIFTPLGMRDSYVDQATALEREHPGRLSSGHVYLLGFPVARTLPHEAGRLPSAALISSAADMGRFLVAQMRTESSEVLSAAGFAQMHTGGAPSNGFSYAFGWRDGTIAGEHAVHHGGIVPHFWGKMVMLPDRHLGVVVLTNVSSAIPWPIAPTSHVMADEIAATLTGVPLPEPSGKHRWLFGAIGATMLLVILKQLRGLLRILRAWSTGARAPGAGMSMIADLAFVAAVAFGIPILAGLSWSELLSAAPDVAWWLIIAATVSLVTAGARRVRLPR